MGPAVPGSRTADHRQLGPRRLLASTWPDSRGRRSISDAADRLLWLADGVLHDRIADFDTAVDPVCGMEIMVDRAAATRQVGGETLWFCSSLCVQKSDRDPSRWVTL